MKVFAAIRLLLLAVAALAPILAQAQADADGYPKRPIHLIVGYAAGGANDVAARIVSQKLTERLGRTVIVENKTGAAGMIGAEYVARAKPDGYTLLFAASSMFTTNPVIYRKVPYSLSNFAPISTVVSFPFFLLVNEQQPIKNVQELLKVWKAKPDAANCSGAAGIHQLSFALFKNLTGGKIGEFIPYRGTNEAINAVIGGNVLITFADSAPTYTAISGGKVRALAVTSAKRLAIYPDLPTAAEAGLPGLEIQSWFGVMAPAGTPAAIVKRLEQELHQIVKTKEFEQFAGTLLSVPKENTPDQFAAMISTDLARWRSVAKDAKIEPIE